MGDGVYSLGRWEIVYLLKEDESLCVFLREMGYCLKEGRRCYVFFRKLEDGIYS